MTEPYDIYECETLSGIKEYGYTITYASYTMAHITWWEITDGTRDGITTERIGLVGDGTNAAEQIDEHIVTKLRLEYGDPK